MSGEEKLKDSTGSKETKKSEPPNKASTSSSSTGLTTPSSVSPHLAPDREEDDPQDAEGMKRSLRQMGIRSPRPFDPKKIETLRVGLNVSSSISK